VSARRRLAVLTFALALAAPTPGARADEPAARPPTGRLRIWVQGGFVPGARDFTGTQTFTEFAEQGRIESQYREDPGPGLEFGLGLRLRGRLGLTAAGSLARRDGTGTFAATLPHPLYFGAFRPAAGDFRGASQSETAVHLDVAFLGDVGRLQWSAFAGPSLLRVRADLVQRVEYTQAYPFDAVTVTGTPLASTRNHAFGFNVGAGLDWPVARHLAIGAQVRFSRATVSLEPTANDRVEIDAGGVALTGGLRLDF
jgi:opacity protein-like surface antigen